MNKEKLIQRMRDDNFTDSIINQFKKDISEERLTEILELVSVDEYLKEIQKGYKIKEFKPRRSYANWESIATAHSCLDEIDVELYKTVQVGRIIEDCGLKYDENGNKNNCFGICRKSGEAVVSFRKESKANIKKYAGRDIYSSQQISASMLILNHVGVGDFEEYLNREYGIDLGPIKDAKEKSMEDQVYFLVRNNETYKSNGKKLKKVLNCAIVPKFLDHGVDGTYLTFDIVSNKYRNKYDKRKILHMSEISSRKKVDVALGEFSFMGSEEDLRVYKDFLTDDLEEVKYRDLLDSAGVHYIDGRWVYVDGEGYFDHEGNQGDDYVAAVFETQKKTAFRDVEKINAEELKEIWDDLFNYNEYDICCNVLLATIMIYMKEIHSKFGGLNTPHMNLCGESGSGKSATLENIFNPLCGIHKTRYNNTATGTTPFALTKESSIYNTLPVVINEFKKDAMTQHKFQLIFDVLRNAYDKASSKKGKISRMGKLDTEDYTFNAPLVLVGETYLNQTATIERSIIFKFYKKLNDNDESKQIFYRLIEKEKLLNKLGKSILCKVMEYDSEKYSKMFNLAKENETVKYAEKQSSSRISKNTMQLVCSIFVLNDILKDLGLEKELMTKETAKKMLGAIHTNIYENALNSGKKNLSDSDKAMEIIGRMIENRSLLHQEDFASGYNKTKGKTLMYIKLRKIYDRYSKYVSDHKILEAEAMSYNEFRQKIKMQKYYIKNQTVKVFAGGNAERADCFDIEEMKEQGIEFPYEMFVTSW